MNFNRINLNECTPINNNTYFQDNENMEYYVPNYDKMGVLKLNNSSEKNSDLRSLLGSIILNAAGIKTADVQLIQNENLQDGCLIISTLEEGEQFIPSNDYEINKYIQVKDIEKVIEQDANMYASMCPSIETSFWEQRKVFYTQYIFLSAFIGNLNIHSKNCQLVYNEKSATIHNPDMYFDMSMSFKDTHNLDDIAVMNELYLKYPEAIEPISVSLQNLNRAFINGILNMPVFRMMSEHDISKIWENLGTKMAIISRQNEQIYNVEPKSTSVLTSIEDIKLLFETTDVQFIDSSKKYFNKILERNIAREGSTLGEACTEVLAILNNMSIKQNQQIPQNFMVSLKESTDQNYKFTIDYSKDIGRQSISNLAKGIICNIYTEYLIGEELKKEANKELKQRRKKSQTIGDSTSLIIESKKENIILRIIRKLKNIFGKKAVNNL